MKILLIEDEAGIAGLIRRGLENANYAVDIAADGKTGLNMFPAMTSSPAWPKRSTACSGGWKARSSSRKNCSNSSGVSLRTPRTN